MSRRTIITRPAGGEVRKMAGKEQSQAELAELGRKFLAQQEKAKKGDLARRQATKVLIEENKPRYQELVKQFSGE